MAKYLVRASRYRTLTDGDQTSLGNIEVSQPGNEWSLVEIDGTPEEIQQKLDNALANSEIVEARPESILYPMGTIDPPERPKKRYGLIGPAQGTDNRMGLDFPTWGITTEWQEIVQSAQNVIVGVADTGRVPEGARDAHAPNVELVHVYGGNDTHGHQTACVLRIVGTRGVLNRASKCVTAQALPNGRGTTSDIVNAIRALCNWRGPNGERVRVISLSLGMDGRDPVIDREIIDTQAQGVACVAAMGNSGWNVRATGTPAAVCLFAAGATTFDGRSPASFSSGGCNLVEETGAGPGENVGLAHLDGGYGNGNGTSFSCPVLAGIVAGALNIGWTVSQTKEYLLSNQRAFNPPRRRGLFQLSAADFGSGNGDTDVDVQEIVWRLQEVDARIELAQQARDAIQRGTMTWDTLYNTELGPSRDLLREAIEIAQAGKAPGGDKPPPSQYADVRTYLKGWSAPQHWSGSQEGQYAIDWYAAELGTEFGWPVGGRTRGRGDVGPLFLPMAGHDCITPPGVIERHAASDAPDDIVVSMVQFGKDDWRPLPKDHVFLPEGYTLYTLILDSDDDETMFAFTHVLREARLDVNVVAHEPFVKVGDSGLEPFTQRGQRPAHIHLAIMRDRNQFGRWQGGVGNIAPWQWLQTMGFQIRNERSVPSPQMYLQGYVNTKPY